VDPRERSIGDARDRLALSAGAAQDAGGFVMNGPIIDQD
jgi:hypothetical protein